MARSHSFSIFLLKNDFNIENSLREGHELEKIDNASTIPLNATLFVGDNPPRPPWWRQYFGIKQTLNQSLKSALLFIPVKDRYFVLSFGHAYSKLNDNSYEYDFGLRVTLNSIEPNQLNSIDIVEPNNGRRRRTQIPNASDITLFDFDKDSSILRNITGHVKDEFSEFFKNPSGASSLKINSKYSANEINELLAKLSDLYELETYKESFPNLLNIIPVKDPDVINTLNDNLITALRDNSENLYLTIPEIVDYQQISHMRFIPRNKSDTFDDLTLERYKNYLLEIGKSLDSVQLEDIKKQKIALIGPDEEHELKRFDLYKCLVFDTKISSEDGTYNLNEGNWYKVKDDYVNELKNYLDPLCRTTILPDYTQSNEGEYNEAVPSALPQFICLDFGHIEPSGETQIEPCDLYTEFAGEALFIHVKRSTKSQSISHLLNQGQNSAQVIRSFDESLGKLHHLLHLTMKKLPFTMKKLPSNRQERFKVCFAIITHKDISKKSENLPFFSRISVMRTLKYLDSINVEAWYEFVPDLNSKRL